MQEHPEAKNDIFIQIAAYRDPQLLPTLKDCIEKARYPENLRFGIAWQHASEDSWDHLDEYKNNKNFKIIDIKHNESKGVCWARNQVQQLYNNEKYTLQLDSHHRFVDGWDVILMEMLNSLQQNGYPKPLITSYIPSFHPDNDPAARIMIPWKLTFDRFIPEGAVFFLPASFDEKKGDDLSQPMLGRFYSAHFAFSIGDFAKEVKHDPNYYFHGEEISIAARAFTHGYDIFYPHKVIAWHEYTRRGRTKHWDDHKKWWETNTESHLRNRKLFGMDNEVQDVDFGEYGFGNKRTLREYEKFAGVDFSKRKVTKDVLDHSLPKFENMLVSDEDFAASLVNRFRHCIDIQYKQVPETDYDIWAVAFKDKDGNEIYREDASSMEIERMKKDPDGYCKIWRTFEPKTTPNSWIVWPHSVSKGWADPIVGKI